MASLAKILALSLGLSLGVGVALPTAAFAITAKESAKLTKQIQAALTENPNGGTDLADAIAAIIEKNPDAAALVASLSSKSTPDQQKAMGGGLAQALVALADKPAAAAKVAAAVKTAPAAVQTAYNAEKAKTVASLDGNQNGDGNQGNAEGNNNNNGGGGRKDDFVIVPPSSGGSGSGNVSGL